MAKQRGRQDYSVNPLAANGVVNKTTTGATAPDSTFNITHPNKYQVGDDHVHIYLENEGLPEEEEVRDVYKCYNNQVGTTYWAFRYTGREGDPVGDTSQPFIAKSNLIESTVTFDSSDVYVDYDIILKDKNANYFKFDIKNVIVTSRKNYAYHVNVDLQDCPNNYYTILDFQDEFSKGSPKLTITTAAGTSTYIVPFRCKILIVKQSGFKTESVPITENCAITFLEVPTVNYTGFLDTLPVGSVVLSAPITGQNTSETFTLPDANDLKEDTFVEIYSSLNSTNNITVNSFGGQSIFYTGAAITTDTITMGTKRKYVKYGINAWKAFN